MPSLEPNLSFINTRIVPKLQKRASTFENFKNNKFPLLILNSNPSEEFNELGYRIFECISIFQEQLPFMPKSYIFSQSFDPENYILALVRENKVASCLLFRPFIDVKLAEIIFLASSSASQSSGFGYLIVSVFKEVCKQFGLFSHKFSTFHSNENTGSTFNEQVVDNETNSRISNVPAKNVRDSSQKLGLMSKEFIQRLHDAPSTSPSDDFFIYTYADFQAASFFRKHQFSKTVTNPNYRGLIKDYEGGYLMECILSKNINYLTLLFDLLGKKNEVFQRLVDDTAVKINERDFLFNYQSAKSFIAENMSKESKDIPTVVINKNVQLKNIMKYIITIIKSEPSSWPFLEPVKESEVPEYCLVIKEPMDLSTMSQKIKDNLYGDLNEFKEDFDLIIKNCYTFNGVGNIYSKKAGELDRMFKSMFKKVMSNLGKS
ncbi:Histone acetyltransferase KAT2A [Cucumispora dikerogammari]|nr:Histone acetyltransferase KAT2A [Cucumispora dikerogammari]